MFLLKPVGHGLTETAPPDTETTFHAPPIKTGETRSRSAAQYPHGQVGALS